MARKGILIGLLVALGFALFLWQRLANPTRQRPLKVALWYWHTPFQISAEDEVSLRSIGIDRFYVLAATVTVDPAPKLILRQTWVHREMRPVHLVFRCDNRIVRAIDANAKALAQELQRLIDSEVQRARREEINVAGVQLDLDCPTRLLPNYAELCRELRKGLSGLELSVTALPTWYTSDKVEDLAGAVDTMAPQLYENELGRTVQNIRPISSLPTFDAMLDRADRLRKPYWAGLAAYGRALLYDQSGLLVGVQDDISARQALLHPSFRLRSAYPIDAEGKRASAETFSGEEALEFEAVQPAPNGLGKGFRLVYLVPSSKLIVRQMEVLEQNGGSCTGVVLFRYPEPGELSTVPLSAVAEALSGRVARPSIDIEVEQKKDPLTSVAGRAVETDLTVYATNKGPEATSVHPEALVLNLELDRPGIEDMVPIQADRVDRGPTSLLRSRALTIRRFHVAPGERTPLVRLRVSGNRVLSGTWSARLPGGFENLSGTIRPVKVLTHERP